MSRGAILGALFGLAMGFVVATICFVAELLARGLPLPGGILLVHRDSAAIWVVDSLPFVLGLAAATIAQRASERSGSLPWTKPAPPVSVASLTAPPLPSPPPLPNNLRTSTIPDTALAGTPPPVPIGLTSVIPGQGGSASAESRLKALQELVKVLKEQGERIATESRAKSAYLANMSHELREPLSAIVGYAELLQEEAEERGLDLADDLRRVGDSGRALVELINNILDVSKIEVGQLAVVLEDVDMAQVVAEVRVGIAPLAARSTVAFSTRVAPGARLVRGDHMRLRQVLLNLLSNAFKFTRQGQISLAVERATPKRDAWIAIRVRDTGPGMTPEEIERAFDEYVQASRAPGQQPGSGLGLAIARKLAELMGGRIEVQSEKGSGSTFSVILPPAKISEDTIAPRSAIALNERLTGTRLLIVDADPFGVSLDRYLERAGLAVKLVPDVDSARIAASAEMPQMAVIDVGLAGSWLLVEDLIVDGVKVVASSLRDEDVENALQLGVTSFMLRPLDRKLVLATLERCLEGGRPTPEGR